MLFTNKYIHKKISYFDSGIKLNLLDNIHIISLDTFKSVVHNINNKQDAWLEFLTQEDPDKIIELVNHFPEFLPCYRELIDFRQNPKELIAMFSDALKQMDRNTERYMVEELNKKVGELNLLNTTLEKENSTLAEEISTLGKKNSTLEHALNEKDLLIQQLQEKLKNN